MASSDQLTGLIVGAGLTLAATLIVQTLVIPWVQTRTRRRAQWEADVISLQSLLEEQVPRAVTRFHAAAQRERSWGEVLRDVLDDPKYDHDRVRDRIREARTAREEAEDLASQQIVRVTSLVARIHQLHRKSPYWLSVQMNEVRLRFYLQSIPAGRDQNVDDEKWNALWKRVGDARNKLVDQIAPLALSMKPPKRQAIKRSSRSVWTLVKAVAGRVNSARVRVASLRS